MAIVPFFAGWRALGRCYRCFHSRPRRTQFRLCRGCRRFRAPHQHWED